MSDSKTTKQKKFLFVIISLFSFIFIPILIIATLLFQELTTPEFYVSILKHSKIIETYVQAKNWNEEKTIKQEIEQKTNITNFRKQFNFIENKYNLQKKEYEKLSREEELDQIKKNQFNLFWTTWLTAPKSFKNSKDFYTYKKLETKRLKQKREEIEKLQEQNKDKIKIAKEQLDKIKREYKDALSTLNEKQKKAEDIVKSHKNSLSNKIYSDLEIIGPELNKELNNRLLEKAVKQQISKLIKFFTTYKEEYLPSNLLTKTLGIKSNRGIIQIPKIKISLWVKDKRSNRTKHLLSDIFVQKVKQNKEIKNPGTFIILFRFTESRLVEMIAGSYLREYNLSIKNGIVIFTPPVLTKTKSQNIASIINILSLGKFLKYFLAGYLFLFLLFLIFSSAGKDRKIKSLKRILKYPSIIIIATSIFLIFYSGRLFDFFPTIISNPAILSFAKSAVNIALLHTFLPIIAIFFILLIFGIIIKKK